MTPQHLYVQWAHSLAPAYTFPLEGENGTRSIAETSTLQWSARSSHLLLLSTQGITIFALHDTALKIHVANGSGGLGKIAAADFVGDVGAEQVMVVWEFGRVNMWDLSTGKGYEIGEAKLGGIRGNSWAVRRLENKTEGMEEPQCRSRCLIDYSLCTTVPDGGAGCPFALSSFQSSTF